ncbi:hypothetical protein BH11ARM2_BH11ARM2_07210 [soil metagenome]
MLPIVPPLMVPDSVFWTSGYKIVHWRHDDIGRVYVKDRRGRVVVQVSDFNVTAEKI